MTRIKLCGLKRAEDIEAANGLRPDYVGFVLWKGSRRYVPPEEAERLKKLLRPGIAAVGVFVDEDPEKAAELLNSGVIDLAQLHGSEDGSYIRRLRELPPGGGCGEGGGEQRGLRACGFRRGNGDGVRLVASCGA